MPAGRCPRCEINFPPNLSQCVVCDGPLLKSPFMSWDVEWESKARALLGESPQFLLIFWELEAADGKESVYPHRYDATAEIEEVDGRLYVKPKELLAAGYGSRAKADQILWLNGRFYEVQGYDRNRFAYWIEEIDPAEQLKDLPVLDEQQSVNGEET